MPATLGYEMKYINVCVMPASSWYECLIYVPATSWYKCFYPAASWYECSVCPQRHDMNVWYARNVMIWMFDMPATSWYCCYARNVMIWMFLMPNVMLLLSCQPRHDIAVICPQRHEINICHACNVMIWMFLMPASVRCTSEHATSCMVMNKSQYNCAYSVRNSCQAPKRAGVFVMCAARTANMEHYTFYIAGMYRL